MNIFKSLSGLGGSGSKQEPKSEPKAKALEQKSGTETQSTSAKTALERAKELLEQTRKSQLPTQEQVEFAVIKRGNLESSKINFAEEIEETKSKIISGVDINNETAIQLPDLEVDRDEIGVIEFDILNSAGKIDSEYTAVLDGLGADLKKSKDGKNISISNSEIKRQIRAVKEEAVEKAKRNTKNIKLIKDAKNELVEERAQEHLDKWLEEQMVLREQEEKDLARLAELEGAQNRVNQLIDEVEDKLNFPEAQGMIDRIEENRKALEEKTQKILEQKRKENLQSECERTENNFKFIEREVNTSINEIKKVLRSKLSKEEVEQAFSKESFEMIAEELSQKGRSELLEKIKKDLYEAVFLYDGKEGFSNIIPVGLHDERARVNSRLEKDISRFNGAFSFFRYGFSNSEARNTVKEVRGEEKLKQMQEKIDEIVTKYTVLKKLIGHQFKAVIRKDKNQNAILDRQGRFIYELPQNPSHFPGSLWAALDERRYMPEEVLKAKIADIKSEKIAPVEEKKETAMEARESIIEKCQLTLKDAVGKGVYIQIEGDVINRGDHKGKRRVRIGGIWSMSKNADEYPVTLATFNDIRSDESIREDKDLPPTLEKAGYTFDSLYDLAEKAEQAQ